MRIERPNVILMTAGLFPAIMKLPDISKWYFNKLYGLGNEDHNTKLRQTRENKRQVKDLRKIKLWNIPHSTENEVAEHQEPEQQEHYFNEELWE